MCLVLMGHRHKLVSPNWKDMFVMNMNSVKTFKVKKL